MNKAVFILAFIFPFVAGAQQGFTISGKVGLKHAARAILTYNLEAETFSDTTVITAGVFKFSGSVPRPVSSTLSIRYYALPNYRPGTPLTADNLTFFIENRPISIVSADSVNNARITGSPINDEYIQLMASINKANPRTSRAQSELFAAYARKNNSSFIGMYALSASLWRDVDDVQSQQIFDQFTPEMRDSPYGQQVAGIIRTMSSTKPGNMAMDFSQNDANGKILKLSDFRGKYVLVDFWASWCGPCRIENPNLVAAYNQFKGKNFTVLGVSLDRLRDNWLKAVKDDRLAWTQVSDLKYWENSAAKLYAVKGIPFNILIAPDGAIVGKNLFGEGLKRKLAEVL